MTLVYSSLSDVYTFIVEPEAFGPVLLVAMEAYLKLLPSAGCQETACSTAAQRDALEPVEHVQPVGAAWSGRVQLEVHHVQAHPLTTARRRQVDRAVGRV